jgi:hypothetical protein
MIFNLNKQGAAELRQMTGNYYAGNDFSAIEMDIEDATDELIQVIGRAVYDKAENAYLKGDGNDQVRLVQLVQRPIALLATLHYFQRNDVSHEDSGRKVKLSSDGTDKIPWEWQLDRDDSIHLQAYYSAVERLIRWLNESKDADWQKSDAYRNAAGLLIRSGREFDTYFPISQSERMYILLLPFLREVQIDTVAPSYGEGFETLLESATSDVRYAASKALALLTMSVALRRMPLQLIPYSVVQGFNAANGMADSQPASLADTQRMAAMLEADAADWLERMRQLRDGTSGEDIPLLPSNSKTNKYFRV